MKSQILLIIFIDPSSMWHVIIVKKKPAQGKKIQNLNTHTHYWNIIIISIILACVFVYVCICVCKLIHQSIIIIIDIVSKEQTQYTHTVFPLIVSIINRFESIFFFFFFSRLFIIIIIIIIIIECETQKTKQH